MNKIVTFFTGALMSVALASSAFAACEREAELAARACSTKTAESGFACIFAQVRVQECLSSFYNSNGPDISNKGSGKGNIKGKKNGKKKGKKKGKNKGKNKKRGGRR